MINPQTGGQDAAGPVVVGVPIAIIGAACRLPGGGSLAAFEQLLFSGGDAVSEIPDSRWIKSRFFDPRPGQPGKSYTFAAGCLPDVTGFDPGFFGMSPREAAHVDPQQRLLLELVQEALEDAGLPAAGLNARGVGVYMGGSSFDYSVQAAGDVAASDAYSMQGGALSSLSNRVSYVYDLHGPSFTVDTACSSSMVALHLAETALARGEIGMAVVGGVNMLLTPQPFVGFARASMLSRTGRCHAFDARADGYVRAEGGGVVILVPLATAQAMGAEIHAVIHASGMNSDGRTHGFSMPNGAAQAALLTRVYDEAGISPDALGYFEAHGTGTPAGDPIEAGAIGTALGKRRRLRLPIGSVKTNVGHLEAASAMAAMMKALIVLRRNRIPRSLHNETPNPNIPFEALNLDLLQTARELPAGSLVGINSFGFGGTNAHVVLGPAPQPAVAPAAPALSLPPLLLSAHSTAALRALAGAWQQRVEGATVDTLAPQMRAMARGRDRLVQRAVIWAEGPDDLAVKLAALASGEAAPAVTCGEAVDGKIAFVFSGNGCQWSGMGQDALAHSPGFRAALAQVEAVLTPQLGWSVSAWLAEPDGAALRDTSVAQPLLFAVQAALLIALRDLGVEPAVVIGHSAGEVAAAFAAGALTLEQAAWVIAARSRHQQDTHDTGRMAALGLTQEAAAEAIAAIDPELCISAVNSQRSVTIAGPTGAIAALVAEAARRGWMCVQLDLEYAFHSAAMDPIEAPLVASLSGLEPAPPKLKLISTVTGNPIEDGSMGADYWWHNVRDPVMFAPALAGIIESGVRIVLEIGPHPVLQPYLREAFKQAGVVGRNFGSLSRERLTTDPVREIAAQCHVAGASIAGLALFDGPRVARGLPMTQWQRAPYWVLVTPEAVPINFPVRDHPLLGFRDSLEPGRWHSHLAVDLEPWLGDHVVAGKAVLPAAAMIEMALAAVRALHPDAEALEIQGLEISQFLPLEHGVTRECSFVVQSDGRFTLASRPRLEDGDAAVHATGRILPGTPGAPATRRHPVAVSRVLSADEIYATAALSQLDYGPAFRTVQQVLFESATEARAVLEPRNILLAEDGWLLHPAVVDGAMHALLAFAATEGATAHGTALVPWRFGRIVLLRPQGAAPVRARLWIRRQGPRSLAAEIALFDAAGVLVAEFLDCWFVRVPMAHGAAASSFFRSVLLPAAAQEVRPRVEVASLLTPLPEAEQAASVALTNAFFAASLAEAIAAKGWLARDVADQPMLAPVIGWLEENGIIAADARGWRVTHDHELPPADDLWRTVFYEVPGAAAEIALASTLADVLVGMLTPAGDSTIKFSGALQEQMLAASCTAAVTADALMMAVDAFVGRWPEARALRVAVVGEIGVELAGRLADRLSAVVRYQRTEFRPTSEEGAMALGDALGNRAGVRVVARARAVAAQFDLVVGVWALGGPLPCTPGDVAALLAPGGTLIAAEPDDGRLVTMLRQAGAWEHGGLNASAAAAELAAHGLNVAGPRSLGGEVWAAALLTANAAEELLEAAPVAPRPAVIVAPAGHGWRTSLRARLPGMRWLLADALEQELAEGESFAGHDVIVLFPEPTDVTPAADILPPFLAWLARTALVLDRAADVRLLLVAKTAGEASVIGAAAVAIRRVIANETVALTCRVVRVDPALSRQAAVEGLAQGLLADDGEPDVVLSSAGRLVPRLVAGLSPAPMAAAAKRGRQVAEGMRLVIDRPGLLTTLRWAAVAAPALGEHDVAIDVSAAGLNFRDVMWALALLPDEALLDGFSGPTLGLECGGIVRAVGAGVTDLRPGDRVIAVAPAALADIAVTRRHAVLKVPDKVDLVAAATMPVTFMTAVYALGHVARVRAGERVLIHAGAGGVGLAAIQYALHRGAVVYATAGDRTRRRMLRRLGVTEVFDSRSARFYDDVLAATGGEGVDVVLNSLAGELMERSLALLRPFGRFLEIGKRDLYRDSTVGLRALRHNVSYFAIDVDELAARRPEEASEVLAEIAALLAADQIRPLPFRRFGYSQAASAFRQMQASGHIGKIVLTPDGRWPAAAVAPLALSADGVFVVTGGLSGFGLAAAKWLTRHGARRLALLSRRGPAAPDAAAIIAEFAAQGVQASAHACDVANRDAVAQTLKSIRGLGAPIRGVLHAAMVLDDALLAQQDETRLRAVIAPKLAGADWLDAFTRADPIELFVLFSSITTLVGNPGQANYVVANAALEAIAQRRRRDGLAGLAVCWGPIADAGYLTGDQRVSDMLASVFGSRHLTAADALDALPALLGSGDPVAGVANVHWDNVRRFLPRMAEPFMADLPEATRSGGDGGSLRAELASLPPEEALARLITTIQEELSQILRLPAELLMVDRAVSDLGMDSLMTVELRSALELRIGMDLPLLTLSGETTLRDVAVRVLKSVLGGQGAAAEGHVDTLHLDIARHEQVATPPVDNAETVAGQQPAVAQGRTA